MKTLTFEALMEIRAITSHSGSGWGYTRYYTVLANHGDLIKVECGDPVLEDLFPEEPPMTHAYVDNDLASLQTWECNILWPRNKGSTTNALKSIGYLITSGAIRVVPEPK